MTETVTIEKQVWESTLNRSMVLEAENAQLKELLKECREYTVDAIQTSPWIDDDWMRESFRDDGMCLLKKIDEVLK